jgi:hypothetical protein
MFVLTDSPDRAFIEHLQGCLERHGIDCLVNDSGRTPTGEPYFAIELPRYKQMAAARRLLYRSWRFPHSIHPQFFDAFMQLRGQPQEQLHIWLTSPWALRFSALCLAIVVVGLAVEALSR